MIQYFTRYVGLIWHILSQFLGAGLFLLGYDDVFPVVHLVTSYLFEQVYTNVGADALRYIDPTWTRDPDSIYPFAV